jgi:hypothetical protein
MMENVSEKDRKSLKIRALAEFRKSLHRGLSDIKNKTGIVKKFTRLHATKNVFYVSVVVLASLSVTIWYAVARGQDLNWDQRNYHIGIPFLLENDNFWSSTAPAGIQSYFNPVLFQLQYFLIQAVHPVTFSVIIAAIQSIAFIIAGIICADIARGPGARANESIVNVLIVILGFMLCLMAPIVLSEAGTTFIEFVTAVPILAAYALIMMRGRRIGVLVSVALAGLLLGLATALKLTNGIFALGVIGFVFAGDEKIKQRAGWLLVYACVVLLSFIAFSGKWHFELWNKFSNPFFPYYNNVFNSPDYAGVAPRDERFLPKSVLDIWKYPLHWLLGSSPSPDIASPSAELQIIDCRWVIAVSGCTAFLAAIALAPRWRASRLIDPRTGLVFAFIISYLIWLGMFGIHRYMAPLDVLCGTIILFLVVILRPVVLRAGMMAAITAAALIMLKVPDWGHLPWKSSWQSISQNKIKADGPSIIFLTGKPSLYIATSFPADSRFVGISGDFDLRAKNNTSLTRQIGRQISESPEANLKVIDQGYLPDFPLEVLESYGLVATKNCGIIKISDEVFRVCDLKRQSAPEKSPL